MFEAFTVLGELSQIKNPKKIILMLQSSAIIVDLIISNTLKSA